MICLRCVAVLSLLFTAELNNNTEFVVGGGVGGLAVGLGFDDS